MTSRAPANSSYAEIEQKYLANINCKQAVESKLKSWGATREWQISFNRGLDGSVGLLSPTKKVGVWTEVRIYNNGTESKGPEASVKVIRGNLSSRYGGNQFFEMDFNQETCEPVREKGKLSFGNNLVSTKVSAKDTKTAEYARGVLDDLNLRGLMAAKGQGIIFVWSPHMPFSYRTTSSGKSALEIIQELSDRLGLNLVVRVDPNANPDFVNRIVAKEPKLQRDPNSKYPATSIEFLFRRAGNHYPNVLVYSNGKLSRNTIPGRAEYAKYEKLITEALSELQ